MYTPRSSARAHTHPHTHLLLLSFERGRAGGGRGSPGCFPVQLADSGAQGESVQDALCMAGGKTTLAGISPSS